MTETTRKTKASLAAVAARARVSLATASKVANGRPDVAAATRERVERAISDLGYETSRRTPEAMRPSTVLSTTASGITTMWFLAPPSACTRLPALAARS